MLYYLGQQEESESGSKERTPYNPNFLPKRDENMKEYTDKIPKFPNGKKEIKRVELEDITIPKRKSLSHYS